MSNKFRITRKELVIGLLFLSIGGFLVHAWDQSQLDATKYAAAITQERYESSVKIYDTVVGCFANGNCDFIETKKRVVSIIGNDKQLWSDFILRTVPHGQ